MTEQNNALTHGGDWAGFRKEYGKDPLDFSMNVNPFGISGKAAEAIRTAAGSAERYPDPLTRSLREALGAAMDLPADCFLCGCGAADLIFRYALAEKPKTALLTQPTFSEYEAALLEAGCQIRRFPLEAERGFRLTEEFLDAIDEDTDCVFLCEPNNPTGVATDPELLRRILARCRKTGTRLVVDECFNGFLDEPEQHSLRGEVPGSPELLILNAFTKMYGMAGVRLGFVIGSDVDLLYRMRNAGPPWSVSYLAEQAGVAALSDRRFVEEARQLIREERPKLARALRELGAGFVTGEANYLLFHHEPGLEEAMRRHGILIRDCSNFEGLERGWYRVAVKRPEENEALIRALREEWK
ncbi:MAG: pyridoxal phosphate-dependent aminotransferase [Anaerovoracaceae bacterium]|jgi:threonine-phosphate decarboxylase